MALYPVNLNITDKLCLVVGGGAVALRKTRGLLASKAKIRLISSKVRDELRILANRGEVEWFERDFVEGDVKGAFLVFAATNDHETQHLVAKEAAKYSVLLNSADDPQNSHFHVPAHFRRGEMLVTVSTGGSSPALSKKMRQQLEVVFAPEYELVVALLAAIRKEIVSLESDSIANSKLFHNLLSQGIVELILQANWFELQMVLLRELPESIDAVALMKTFLKRYDSENC